MKPFVRWYTRICGFSALAAITVQAFTLKSLALPQLPKWLNLAVPLLAATATYMLLYNLLIWLYETKAWKLVLKEYDISGTWYHEYQSKVDPVYIRRCVTFINQGVWQISFNGRNYDLDLNSASRTMWKDTAVALNDNGLVVAYRAIRNDQTNLDDPNIGKDGVIEIQIVPDNKGWPCRLVGIFQDSWPSRRRGNITWWRKTDWSEDFESRGL